MRNRLTRCMLLGLGAFALFTVGTLALAAAGGSNGIGNVASNVTGNLGNMAKLVTAVSYVGGMGFVVGAIAKFKAHKDNPTQEHISKPIVFLFIGAALLYSPSVFKTGGGTLFGGKRESVASVSGISSFST